MNIFDFIFIAGFLLIVAGISLWSIPAGLVAAGTLLVLLAVFLRFAAMPGKI